MIFASYTSGNFKNNRQHIIYPSMPLPDYKSGICLVLEWQMLTHFGKYNSIKYKSNLFSAVQCLIRNRNVKVCSVGP
jgi:hypothetical protein